MPSERFSDDEEGRSNPLFKAKMFAASKAVQTKLGNKVISHFIGEDGNNVLV
jgi:hypothetical protein